MISICFNDSPGISGKNIINLQIRFRFCNTRLKLYVFSPITEILWYGFKNVIMIFFTTISGKEVDNEND